NSSASPDELHDSFGLMQKAGSTNPNASWQIAVPNGTYSVHVLAGDPIYTDSIYKINVNGVLVINGTSTSAKHWFENTLTITVTNGLLTLTNATGSSNNKVDAIDITTAPAISLAGSGQGQLSALATVRLNPRLIVDVVSAPSSLPQPLTV